MVETSLPLGFRLPPGFRFHPTDIELLKYYLKRKIMGKKLHFEAISEVDIYKYAPWDLPDKSCLQNGDLKWYFFCPREKKYASGARMNRATEFGFWKTTGRDRTVHNEDEVVGMIKTLIFHTGHPPRGNRTNWVMHEYRLGEQGLADRGVKDSYVLSVIFQKAGSGPRNGAQYGAPYKEEEWTSDEEDNCVEPGSSANGSVLLLPSSHNNYATNIKHASGSKCMGSSSESCISDCIPPTSEVPQPVPPTSEVPQPVPPTCEVPQPVPPTSEVPRPVPPTCEVPQPVPPTCEVPHRVSTIESTLEEFQVPNDDDDMAAMLDCFFGGEDICEGNENGQNEDPCTLNNVRDIGKTSNFDGNDIFMDLGDLGNLAGLSEDGCGFPGQRKSMYYLEQMHSGNNFLELMDLDIPLNCSAEAGGYGCVQLPGPGTGYNTSNNPDQFPCAAAGHASPSQSALPLEKEFMD